MYTQCSPQAQARALAEEEIEKLRAKIALVAARSPAAERDARGGTFSLDDEIETLAADLRTRFAKGACLPHIAQCARHGHTQLA